MKEGLSYWRSIRKGGVPVLQSHIIHEARGHGQVEEAVIAKVVKDWRPKPNTALTFKVGTICLGYGLVSSTELTRLAECEHRYDIRLGDYIPVHNANKETTVAGIYAVGDGAGVAGRRAAIEEGCIAGISVASSLDYLSAAAGAERIKPHQKRLVKIQRFQKTINAMSSPRAGLYELARDDTVLCRCEEVTIKQLKTAMAATPMKVKDLKRMTRMGMGPCEGRMCGPSVIEIMKHRLNVPAESVGYLGPRPTIKPVALGVLAAGNAEK